MDIKPKRKKRMFPTGEKGSFEDGKIRDITIEKEHIWQLFGPFDFFTIQHGCEQFESMGWKVENTFMVQVLVKPPSNVLHLNKQATPQIQNNGYALCSKWMSEEEHKQHLDFYNSKAAMERAKNGKIIT